MSKMYVKVVQLYSLKSLELRMIETSLYNWRFQQNELFIMGSLYGGAIIRMNKGSYLGEYFKASFVKSRYGSVSYMKFGENTQ